MIKHLKSGVKQAAMVATTVLAGSCATGSTPNVPTEAWQTLSALGLPTARHEAAVVAYQQKLYLMGGRRINPTDVFDPVKNTWQVKAKPPIEIHHFQPVVWGDAIYLVGAMTGDWPNETALERVIIYYPETDEFKLGATIPEARRRGGAGAVVHNNKIYLVGGITHGHMEGAKAWLDEFDPQTGLWRVLPDAPHARDHFQAAVINNKLYAAGGRTTSHKTQQGIDLTVAAVDVFDFASMQWLPTEQTTRLPTERAGTATFVWGEQLVVGGGESIAQQAAHNEIEAFDVVQQQWQRWPALQQGRHGSGFAVINQAVYIASGCGQRGGTPELTTIERLHLP